MSIASTKKARPRYVLIIEENIHHAELLTEILDRHFAPVIIHTVDKMDDGIEFASQSNYDIIITSGAVHDTPIPEIIPKLMRVSGGVPVIVVSGKGDEKIAAEFIKKGAAEYLSKTREALENLPALLQKHFTKRQTKRGKPFRHRHQSRSNIPSSASIVRRVEKITQQALAITRSKRRKRQKFPHDMEQLNNLINQIQHLRELATELTRKTTKKNK